MDRPTTVGRKKQKMSPGPSLNKNSASKSSKPSSRPPENGSSFPKKTLPTTTDPSQLVPITQQARTSIRRAHALAHTLSEEKTLLSHMQYRDHAGLNNALWYHAGDNVLRTLERVLGDQHPSPQLVRRQRRQARKLPISARGKRGANVRYPDFGALLDPGKVLGQAGQAQGKQLDLGPCALRDAFRTSTRAYLSMYPPNRRKVSTGRNPLVPPKISGPPPRVPPQPQASQNACLALLQLSVQFVSLLDRCQAAWRSISLHLRTPPAPTFVPSALAMLAIISRIHAATREVLWGKFPALPATTSSTLTEIESNKGLVELYGIWRSYAGTTPSEPVDLYQVVCALRGVSMDSRLEHWRTWLTFKDGNGLTLPSSLGLEYDHKMAVGGVPWLFDLRYSDRDVYHAQVEPMRIDPATGKLSSAALPEPTGLGPLPFGDDEDDLGEAVEA